MANKTPTSDEKIAVLKKFLAVMISDYKHADCKMGRKSWKSVAESFYSQAKSLEDLLNNEGFLYALLCEQEQPRFQAVADDNFSSAPSKKGTVSK